MRVIMVPIALDGPAVEPVSVPEMRAYLRLDHEAEDELIAGLVKAGRLLVEAASRRVLIESRWRVVLDRWPADRVVRLPLSPLIAVERIGVRDAAGVESDLAGALFHAETSADPPLIRVMAAAPDPGVAVGGIAIDLRAGFGAAPPTVPAPLRQAIRMLVARWFENRGDVAGLQTLPAEVQALVAPYQRARL
jgi:uncharacterized phiE125 gp8 family phage protein